MKKINCIIAVVCLSSSYIIFSMECAHTVASDLVWIHTKDNHCVGVKQKLLRRMDTLQLCLTYQRGSNNKSNPLDTFMCTKADVRMMKKGFNALEGGAFKKLYEKYDVKVINTFLNVAGLLGATDLFEQCAAYYFPQDLQVIIRAAMITRMELGLCNDIINNGSVLFTTATPFSVFTFDSNDKIIFSNTNSDIGKRWDLDTRKYEDLPQIHRKIHRNKIFMIPKTPACIVSNVNNSLMVVGYSHLKNNLLIVDTTTPYTVGKLINESYDVIAIAIDDKGSLLVSLHRWTNANNLLVWNLAEKKLFIR